MDDLKIHGFLSQGMLYTTNNVHVYGDSPNVSFDFQEAGINISKDFTSIPGLRFTAQGVYRNVGESDIDEPRLDFALLDYSQDFVNDLVLGVRLGRVKIPYGFYNDTRDSPFSRPGLWAPQSMYLDWAGNRQMYISGDGGVLYGSKRYAEHEVGYELYAVDPHDNDNLTKQIVFVEIFENKPNHHVYGDMTGEPMMGGRLKYDFMGGKVKLMYSLRYYNRKFIAQPGNGYYDGYSHELDHIFSFQYNQEKYSITAEYWHGDTDGSSTISKPNAPHERFVPDTAYIQVDYRFTPELTIYSRYDHDSLGSQLMDQVYTSDDIGIGARYQPTYNWLFMLEYHHYWGTLLTSTPENLFNNGNMDFQSEWDILGASVSYRF